MMLEEYDRDMLIQKFLKENEKKLKEGLKKGEEKGRKEEQIKIALKMFGRLKYGERLADLIAQLLDLDIPQDSIDEALESMGLAIQAD